MPNIQHATLTGADLHEPKGVAEANEGSVYIADGSGSGTWTQWPLGWAVYSDNDSEQTFDTTAAKLSINGSGSSSNSTYLPLAIRGSGELWDTTNDKITPIAEGDTYNCRVNLPITSRTSANYAEVQLDIGGAATPTNVIGTWRIETDRAAPFHHSLTLPIFSLSTFVANGGQIFIKTDSGSIGVTAPSIFIDRNNTGEI